MILEILVLGLFPAAMAFAAASDLVSMTISNRVSLALIIGFFLVAWMTGMGWTDIGRHLLAGAAVLVVSFGFFARGWIGGGDAKLAAATALWLGFSHLMEYLLIASVFGGILTLALLQLRSLPIPAMLARQKWIARLHNFETGIPYGIALALAGLLVYPETSFMKALAL
ncbi:MAG: prepilin peptidase [Xanthobacteraceae bacterium]|nr:prepilin peptidase [Xanthobacteraceae bacterium]MBX3524080.1 prepilin peptidase [Xanthobacteraceae bacterium]MBX3533839.1 prepilin peptidase [Xanthobacteraceae bacterium]MBX3549366.1 prepilin peptidase [Xanthobacteraceae bacterium]MCW5673553.1 prepilin peptidase [Xanthobacteraceae bacterium]